MTAIDAIDWTNHEEVVLQVYPRSFEDGEGVWRDSTQTSKLGTSYEDIRFSDKRVIEFEKQNRPANARTYREELTHVNMRRFLKKHFPWLGTDQEVSGADVIDKLNKVYADLRKTSDWSTLELPPQRNKGAKKA